MELFILGVLTVSFFLPIIDGLVSLILTIFECIKGYFGIKIAKYNQKLTGEESIKEVGPIGFIYEEDEENEELL